jgi:cell division protease FtsH
MVTKWGLSEKMGPLAYGEEEGEVFLGHSVTQHKNIADTTASEIDTEIRAIIDRNYQRAKKLLEENMDKLHIMSEALIKYETIDKEQIDDIMAGREPRPPKVSGSGVEPPSGSGAPSKGKEDRPSVGGSSIPASQH